ncbi:hypothetical protein U14_03115 [Candidatus Moduliflexus flocculans]|uniref:ParB-like N-terminal domain-containing protein n=1 Tax=Candidatus Moduliflexus flocculans TaxID=1499966 RepID=A0A081BNA3_9BACT|nr:hypothetical protein U14_03115 [Candidatus Moduliflexus flocculans]
MFHIIEIAQLDFDDTTFSMSYPLTSATVAASVATVGVINPILVSGCACQGKYQIVAGFRRANIARDIGIPALPAQIYQVDPENPLAAFSVALCENAAHRVFNHVEKALILHKLSEIFHCPADELVQTFLPLLGLAPNEKVLAIYRQIAEFEDEHKPYLAAHDLPLSLLELLTALAPEDRRAAFKLVSALNINLNKLRELLTFAEEIALRDGCAMRDVLASAEIGAIIAHEKFSAPQKIEAIRDWLRKQRFPRLTALEQEYAAVLKRLKPPKGVQLTTDKSFEDETMSATFRFSTPEQLAVTAEHLAQLAGQPELNTLLRLIQEGK